ncbi:MAG: calcium-binding protein, partial [Jannaschia sp.]
MSILRILTDDFSRVVDAFVDGIANREPDVLVSTSNVLVIFDAATGVQLSFSGTGFVLGEEGPVAGTVTGITASAGGTTLATVTDIVWGLVALVEAIDRSGRDDDPTLLAALFSQNAVTVDARDAAGPVDIIDDLDFFADFVTSPITVLGSPFDDSITGGLGNDTLEIGQGDSFQFLWGTQGNDLYVIPDLPGDVFTEINYRPSSFGTESVTVSVNGPANTATVSGSAGWIDTFENIIGAVNADGMRFTGTDGNDTFNLINSDQGWIEADGGSGNDIFNLTLNSTIRLNFHYNGSIAGPFEGVVADLATGVVSQDGFGGSDQINIIGGTGRMEIRLTQLADVVTGSDRSERFILEGGNDTVDAGGGFDLLRLDRDRLTDIVADTAAGIVTGIYRGTAFESRISNFEQIEAGRENGAIIRGNDTGEEFFGNRFADELNGRAGNDFLRGDGGNDTLIGGDGRDTLFGDDGDDRLDASGGAAGTQGFGDYVRPGLGQNTILGHAALYADGEGIDISYSDIRTATGVDITVAADGSGTTTSRIGTVIDDTFTFAHYFEGSFLADRMESTGGDGWRGFVGLDGADTIVGGGAEDTLIYDNDAGYGGTLGVIVNFRTGRAKDGWGNLDVFAGIEGARGTDFDDLFAGGGIAGDRIVYEGLGGIDTFRLAAADDVIRERSLDALAGSVIVDFTGADRIEVQNLDAASVALDYNTTTGLVRVDLNADGTFETSFTLENGPDALAARMLDGGSLLEITVDESTGSLTPTEGDDTLIGTDAGEVINGLGGNDLIRDGLGNDTVDGGAGNDTIENGGGTDIFRGGGGRDRLVTDVTGIADDGSVLLADLAGNRHGRRDSDIGQDTLESIEDFTFIGDWDAEIRGSATANRLEGGSGDDTIRGAAGNDLLIGNGGRDLIEGGGGDDTIDASGGDPASQGFGDIILAGTGRNTIIGGAAAHAGNRGGGIDIIWQDVSGTGGIVVTVGPDGTGTAVSRTGGVVDDTFTFADHFEGTQEADTFISTSAQYNGWVGEGGNDTITGGTGTDVLFYRLEEDGTQGIVGDLRTGVIRDSYGDTDQVSGIDAVEGTTFADDIFGGTNAEFLATFAGADTLNGWSGDDTLDGGSGDELMIGGVGSDLFYVDSSTDRVVE